MVHLKLLIQLLIWFSFNCRTRNHAFFSMTPTAYTMAALGNSR